MLRPHEGNDPNMTYSQIKELRESNAIQKRLAITSSYPMPQEIMKLIVPNNAGSLRHLPKIIGNFSYTRTSVMPFVTIGMTAQNRITSGVHIHFTDSYSPFPHEWLEELNAIAQKYGFNAFAYGFHGLGVQNRNYSNPYSYESSSHTVYKDPITHVTKHWKIVNKFALEISTKLAVLQGIAAKIGRNNYGRWAAFAQKGNNLEGHHINSIIPKKYTSKAGLALLRWARLNAPARAAKRRIVANRASTASPKRRKS